MDYFDWINGILIPRFMLETEQAVKKPFQYSLALARDAGMHADAMRKNRAVYHAPFDLLGEAEAENIYSHFCCSILEGLVNGARKLCSSDEHRNNLERFSVIGVGIAIEELFYGTYRIYITQRLKN